MAAKHSSNASPFHWDVFGIYAAFGPPLGANFLALIFGISQMAAGNVDRESIEAFAVLLIMISLLSYLFGGVQAIATGLIVGLAAKTGDGRIGWFAAFMAPVIVSIAAAIFFIGVHGKDILGIAIIHGILCILTSLLLKLMFRRTFGTQFVL